MTRREVTLAMSALIACMFVASLSNLLLLTALPSIAADLKATQAHYTWMITAAMLMIAVSTPLWGRLSDIFDPKRLMQGCVALYVAGSLVASTAQTAWVIIACRVCTGICAAGIIVLLQTISAAIMSSRERAGWIGYRAAALSVATLGAPFFGGLVTEHLGWRACFLVGLPFAVVSIALLQRTLHLPPRTVARPRIDWAGAALLALGILALTLWISVTGPNEGFFAPVSLLVAGLGIALLAIFIAVERRAAMPIMPLELLRRRDVLMCVVASATGGVAMFAGAVFLSQYLQIGRGLSPSASGLMALPEAGGSLIASIVTARLISRRGHYKRTLVIGATLMAISFGLLASIGPQTPLWCVAVYIAVLGASLGVTAETLSIVVQNGVPSRLVGTASALVGFFRIAGGMVSIAVFGAILGSRVTGDVAASGAAGFDGRTVPSPGLLPEPLAGVVAAAYADGVAFLYLLCIPVALVMMAALMALPAGTLSDEDPWRQND